MQGADDLLAEILEHTIQRKEKRGDLGWRQGISIGQHSSDTYVLWRSINGFSGCLSGKRSLKNLEQDKKFKERDIPGRLQQPDASFHSERNHQGNIDREGAIAMPRLNVGSYPLTLINMMRQDKKRRRKRKRKSLLDTDPVLLGHIIRCPMWWIARVLDFRSCRRDSGH